MESFLNINKKYESEETEGKPKTSDKLVNNRKYWKYDHSYLDFGFASIDVSHQEHPQFV